MIDSADYLFLCLPELFRLFFYFALFYLCLDFPWIDIFSFILICFFTWFLYLFGVMSVVILLPNVDHVTITYVPVLPHSLHTRGIFVLHYLFFYSDFWFLMFRSWFFISHWNYYFFENGIKKTNTLIFMGMIICSFLIKMFLKLF